MACNICDERIGLFGVAYAECQSCSFQACEGCVVNLDTEPAEPRDAHDVDEYVCPLCGRDRAL